VTGFRHPGGLQRYFGVKPDVTTLGKAVGGQYFAGAGGLCGISEVMDLLDQTKRKKFWERSFLGGTYTGNSLSMRAGHAVISELERRKEEVYPFINSLGDRARKGIAEAFEDNRFEAYVTGLGSMFGIHISKEIPTDAESASRTKDLALHRELFDRMLRNGVAYMTPQSPHMAISFAHDREDIDRFATLVDDFARAHGKGS
jgi:glutamate-1-semialdehyde 2,1-aminomutase